MSTIVRNGCLCLLAVMVLLFLAPTPATAQPCDDKTRDNFQADVERGLSNDELESLYAHCRDSGMAGGAEGLATKTIQFGNTIWETMNGCGYHPQAEMVSCDVQINQTAWYGPFPAGSFEHVRFCLDCDGNWIWDYTTLGFVHVTNNNFVTNPFPTPPWFHEVHATTFNAPVACTNNNGGQMNGRFILSWAALPPNCTNAPMQANNALPIFGAVFTETLRRDP